MSDSVYIFTSSERGLTKLGLLVFEPRPKVPRAVLASMCR